MSSRRSLSWRWIAGLALLLACGPELSSPEPERRAAAVAKLAKSHDETDFAPLRVAAHDRSALVRLAAASALAARGGRKAVDALGELLHDVDRDVVAAAARGLGQMPREPKVRDHLIASYGAASAEGRAEIARALYAIGTSLREAIEAEARSLWERNLRALDSGTPAERVGAVEEIGRSGRAEAVQRLLPLVDLHKTASPLLIAAAARGLGSSADRKATPALVELLDAGDPRLREAAAEALGVLSDPASVDALARAAWSGTSELASIAVTALVAMPPAQEAGIALCEVASRTLEPELATRAAREARLREAECPDKPLIARLRQPGPEVASALAALGVMDLGASSKRAVAERALVLLTGPSAEPGVRTAATQALADLGWTDAGPKIVKVGRALFERRLASREKWDPEPLPPTVGPGARAGGGEASLRAQAEAIAARLESHPAVPVAAAASRPDAGARDARWLLSRFADDPTRPPEWIEDFDPAETPELAAATSAMARLKAPGAKEWLLGLLDDPDESIRAMATNALASAPDEGVQRRLVAALADPSAGVRSTAAAAVARASQGESLVGPLIEALKRLRDPEARDRVARALGDTRSPQAVPALAALLDGVSARAAAQALGRLALKEGAQPLLDLLKQRQALGRLEAVEALAAIAAPESADALRGELTSDCPEVRAAAARALGKLGDDASSQLLEALRSDYHVEVRKAAVEALAKLPTGVSPRTSSP